MDKKPAPEALRDFVHEVKREFNAQAVVLFGSQARGDATEHSDYDLLIISTAFANLPYLERLRRVRHLFTRPVPVDLICLTPQEFAEASQGPTIEAVIAKEGVELVA